MKTFLLIIALFFGTNAFARDYCDTVRDSAKCWQTGINHQQAVMRDHMKVLQKTMPADKYKALTRDSQLWALNINNACIDNLACTYTSTKNRNAYLKEERDRYTKKK